MVILNCFEMILLFNVWVWISSITTPKLLCKALELFSLSRFLIVICVELNVDKSMLSFTWIVLVELLLMPNKNELGILFWTLNSIAIFSGC